MSCDLVAVVRRPPDVRAVLEGLIAMGVSVEIRGGEPAATRLYNLEGQLIVSIENPVQVAVPGEIRRLLGAEFAARLPSPSAPMWWVDVRAVADLPEGVEVARRFADALVHWLGGAVYPDGESDGPPLSWRAADHSGATAGSSASSSPAPS
ncbi:hypothetical protein Arub01_35160 [Actinomadura rubrobrunea]|uniref:Uncharacterized protein n=1 Tax=Actinomadura rubrobrunea TaxID=115335 RepID=A0A9W6PWZ0_9ACTN|nr:hypothetical protein [Actinomadura rubrobrunea]GLW65272.1 hypothetical protein Arub01_35160 [Actinomadura rubrobrunea]